LQQRRAVNRLMVTLLVAVATAGLASASGLESRAQETTAPPRPECGDWRECQQRALEAAAAGQYETFHDLAWRAVQKGPPRDPSLMHLLARAQSLSGRPHDALVMLLRLAERGIETDAATSEDFAAVRRLPQWAEHAGRFTAGAAAGERADEAAAPRASMPPSGADRDAANAAAGESTTGAPSETVTSTAAGAPVARAGGGGASGVVARSAMAPIEDALRVPALTLTPMALAHDRASGRFVFGDAPGRRLVIVDERMHFVVDLVRERSAGFYDITALELDSQRGDLWVVSADRAGATALHHLQMVSGRPLARYDIPPDMAPGRFEDVAVASDGTVYVLDALGRRLLSRVPRANALALAARLDVEAPSSIATAPQDVVYVAHPGGILRVDVHGGRAQPLRVGAEPPPAFVRLRWQAGALVGVERLGDGACRILRLPVTAAGDRAQPVQVLASHVDLPDPAAMTVTNGAVYYVSREKGESGASETVVKRLAISP
jgi:hypothetical protein